LNKEINAGLADPNIRKKYDEFGVTPFPSSPGELGKQMAGDIQKWAKVVAFAGIKPQ
jgi:tripartite-type tricarboxylate transporter receptor subunit TctC